MKEKIAELIHKTWSNWINYIFSVATMNDDGSLTIPEEKVKEWLEISKKPFDHLLDKDRQYAIDSADKFLKLSKNR